jgi:hypothetical protein
MAAASTTSRAGYSSDASGVKTNANPNPVNP